MFAPRPFRIFRVLALVVVTAVIAVVTAFDYDPNLPFSLGVESAQADDSSVPTEGDVLAGELTPSADAADAATVAETVFVLTPIGEFDAPVEVIHRVGDNRDFVVEQSGRIIAAAATGTEAVADVSALTSVAGERGLLGAAFHPSEAYVYVHYTDVAGDTVVDEFAIDPTSAVADDASRRNVLRIEQPYENHNGGELTFGPDGYLYLGLGDGGLADDPIRAALDLTSPLGKILRIDPTLSASGEAFTVPADNPFIDLPEADPTIWSYGLRNPWKFSFDAATGDLWIADVGQNQYEEINQAVAVDGMSAGRGVSFGWSAFEGDERFNEDQTADGHTAPFATYPRDEGKCSVSGGAVYRGADLPLEGWYVFGDYCTGSIWAFDSTDASADPTGREIANVGALVAVVADGDGGLFAVSNSGTVYRVDSNA